MKTRHRPSLLPPRAGALLHPAPRVSNSFWGNSSGVWGERWRGCLAAGRLAALPALYGAALVSAPKHKYELPLDKGNGNNFFCLQQIAKAVNVDSFRASHGLSPL